MAQTPSENRLNTGKAPKVEKTDVENISSYFSFYLGKIKYYNQATGLYKIEISNKGTTCIYARALTDTFSDALGIKSKFRYAYNTNVLVGQPVYSATEPGIIIGALEKSVQDVGAIPKNQTGDFLDEKSYYQEMNSFETAENFNKEGIFQTNNAKADVIEGENISTNSKGSGLISLDNLVKLVGSDLAKIECFNIDDFVRIVSDNFKHITCFGDKEIYNDNGNLNVVWKGTSYEHETYDINYKDSPKPFEISKNEDGVANYGNVTSKSNDKDLEKIFYEEGRSRFAEYIGKLGNIFNLFISDPRRILNKYPEYYYVSKGRLHINEDGSIVMQSAGDIIIEKTGIGVPSPTEIERKEFVEQTRTKLDAYKNWIIHDEDDLFHVLYQWADYTKWFNNYYSMAEFFADEKRYHVPSETECEAGMSANNVNEDKEIINLDYENTFSRQKKTFAKIVLSRDGSVLVIDTNGSAINMSGGDITISSAKNIKLSAANNIIMESGGDITALAAGNIEFSSIFKGLILKSKRWIQNFCSNGPILLQSTFNPNRDITDGIAERFGGYNTKNGIILKTTNSSDVSVTTGGQGSFIINCKNMIVKTLLNVIFTAQKFLIDKIAMFMPGKSYFRGMAYSDGMQSQLFQQGEDIPAITFGGKQSTLVSYNSGVNSQLNALNSQMTDMLKGNSLDDHEKKALSEDISSSVQFSYRSEEEYDTSSTNNEYRNVYVPITQAYINQNKSKIFLPGYKAGEDSHTYTQLEFTELQDFGNGTTKYPYPGKYPQIYEGLNKIKDPAKAVDFTYDNGQYKELRNTNIAFVTKPYMWTYIDQNK